MDVSDFQPTLWSLDNATSGKVSMVALLRAYAFVIVCDMGALPRSRTCSLFTADTPPMSRTEQR
jgi:hypothetical protein